MTEFATERPSFFQNLRRNTLVQGIAIGTLALLLQIPVLFIQGLVWERESTRQTAIEEITGKWGRAQDVFGPFLVVPYLKRRIVQTDENKPPKIEEYETQATFLPRQLKVDGTLETEVRYRGIFEAPVYRSQLVFDGSFERPDFSGWTIDPSDILWDRAELVVEVADPRAIQNAVQLDWAGDAIEFEPGTGRRPSKRSGIYAALGERLDGDDFSFHFTLDLNGSVRVSFAPVGRNTEVKLRGDWPSPSFQGNWLPVSREVGPTSFSASWNIPYLGRSYPQRWRSGDNADEVAASQFGVNLLSPVDAYRQTVRSLKYQILFLSLTFLTVWLFEILSGVRLHLIQYGFIGMALCTFYLLELSLAEHLGFATAYAIAASAVIGLVTFYARATMGSARRGGIVGAVIVSLYGFLYVLLLMEEYSLLVGSVGLFLILAAIMFVTRHVDWDKPVGAASAIPNAPQVRESGPG
ncbi:MAG: cell envelope integrity protein CreD [Acidobacteria bacterium]|nr:cell envelope integrity protein CreD [Acidobacteriota bacterium]